MITDYTMIRTILTDFIKKNISADTDFSLEKPKADFGDYASNVAFLLAKGEKKSPIIIAQELAEKLRAHLPKEIERLEAAEGFINFFVTADFLQKQIFDLAHKKEIGEDLKTLGAGKTVIVEYSSANIAKPMHVGHLRGTMLGDALANIYALTGHRVIRWNYYGDWGTQFGKLIAAYKMWGDPATVKANPIQSLLDLYVRFHGELEEHPDYEARGQEEFQRLEAGDSENVNLWLWFKGESIKEFDRLYARLRVHFDVDIGESFYENKLEGVVKELVKKKIAVESEGAIVAILDNLPPALIQKSDGASLYHTRDIANLEYRIETYKPAAILYVVGNEQSLHFQQLFAIAKKMGISGVQLDHIKHGAVLDENGGKFATREGRIIPAEEVVDKAVSLARGVVELKNPTVPPDEKNLIAESVGIGALKYEMLKDHRHTDIVFDWKRMLDFSGNSGPYLQYTFARLMSILHKAGEQRTEADVSRLTHVRERALLCHLIEFDNTIIQAAHECATNQLALYLYELANLCGRYYEEVRVLQEPEETIRRARLLLVDICARVLERGLFLLGITALPRM